MCRFAARVSKVYDELGRLNRAVKALRRHYLEVFWDEFRDEDGKDLDPTGLQALLKASAWYQVCYGYREKDHEVLLVSFAWVAHECLCRLKLLAQQQQIV